MIKVRSLGPKDVAGICDHTFLQRPECYRGKHADPLAAYENDFRAFLEQTARLQPLPFAVCVRAEEARRAWSFFAEAGCASLRIAATVGFPLGDAVSTRLKVYELEEALAEGAAEIDTVLLWGALKAGNIDLATADLAAVVDAAHDGGALVKVIIEVCELDVAHIRRACELCAEVGADFVKTSTGFGRGGATEQSLRVMREYFAGGIKISGGVKAENVGTLLAAAVGAKVDTLDPLRIRIGESSLLLPGSPA